MVHAYCIAQSTEQERHEASSTGPGRAWRGGFMLTAGSGLAAKALGHSHVTCRSGLAISFIALTEKRIVSHRKEDTLSPVRSKIIIIIIIALQLVAKGLLVYRMKQPGETWKTK